MVCVPERLHLCPRKEGCRRRHGGAAVVTLSVVVVVVEASAAKVYTRVTLASASTLSGSVVRTLRGREGLLNMFCLVASSLGR